MDAAGVYSTRDLFEGGHAIREEVVGHETGDPHHCRTSVVELLGLQIITETEAGRQTNTRQAEGAQQMIRQPTMLKLSA